MNFCQTCGCSLFSEGEGSDFEQDTWEIQQNLVTRHLVDTIEALNRKQRWSKGVLSTVSSIEITVSDFAGLPFGPSPPKKWNSSEK